MLYMVILPISQLYEKLRDNILVNGVEKKQIANIILFMIHY